MNNNVFNNNAQGNILYSTSIISTFLKGSTMLDPNKPDPNAKPQTGLSIYNAFTGMKIVAPFNIFTSLDSFKVYIAQNLKIAVEDLFLITPLGIKFRFSMIVHEQINEVFVFNRRFFNPILIKNDRSDMVLKELLSSLSHDEHIFMIKPRESPLSVSNIDSFIQKLDTMLSKKNDNGEIIVNSTDLEFDSLRLLLNLLKRNSGWSSALLSDMRSALYNNVYYHDYEIVENILRALNSLIQYFSNCFTSLENGYNQTLDKFGTLTDNSLADRWQICFRLLEKIPFSYTDKKTNKLKKMILSELIDLAQTESAAKKSKLLSEEISKYLMELKQIIEVEIMKQREKILQEYESFKALYLKPEWDASEKETIDKSNAIYKQLEKTVNHMSSQLERLPSFEELITTSDNLSTYLSQDAISKISLLINSYKSQSNVYVPQITKLANTLYDMQHKYSDVREELQKKIISSTILSIVQIQLSISKANKILNQNIATDMNVMKSNDLQLSLVADLPILFGIWIITILSSIKHGTSLKKLSRKTNEVLEMMNFLEKKNKTEWLQDFIEGAGAEKVDLMFLSSADYKNKFISSNISQFQLIIYDENEKPPVTVAKRKSSESNNYLAPLNKMLQNFNGLSKNNNLYNVDPDVLGDDFNDLLKGSNISFFEGLLTSITLKDVLQYLKNLEKADYEPTHIIDLKNHMKCIGIESSDMSNKTNDNGMVAKSENFEDLGSFDFQDAHYIKIFKKFIKNFESDGIVIDIKIRNVKIEKSVVDAGLISIYEERIQKLENLLHEKKFPTFNTKWSQSNRNTVNIDGVENANFIEDQIVNTSAGVLGRKTIKLPPVHYSEKIQQLEDENKNLKVEVDEYRRSQTGEEVDRLKKMIDMNELQLKNYQAKIEDFNSTINDKDRLIAELRQQIEKLDVEKSGVVNENKKLHSDINELNILNKDLLENMSNKENELLNENQLNQKEKNDLKLRIEELLDVKNQYERVLEKIKEMYENISSALSILSFAFKKLKDLSMVAFSDMETFCLILEIIGLLLIEDDKSMDIKRVKGLKYTKKELYMKIHGIEKSDDAKIDEDGLFFEIVASSLPTDSKNSIGWVPEIEGKIKELQESSCFAIKSATESDGEKSKIKEIEETLESLNKYDSKLKSVIEIYSESETEGKYDAFIHNTNIERSLILNRVHKRFEDVESLARKLQKEKVQLKGDIKMLTKKLSQQLVLRNFQKNDLVLFLKTLVPVSKEESVKVQRNSNLHQPWAVFNIGSPNYYLKQDVSHLEEKEWFVGRIRSVEEHLVDVLNKDSAEDNPFNLGVGTRWFFVETVEESVSVS